ncbi:ABC transporter permease [Bradyrhizobium sp. HKCCYLS20291]|uniref:ABC transporter permease n=1 Tax=Bradyrhizobium sp. HKCCYLS20291 TaxID=3420766 RepID=UPI003EB93636
MFGWLTSRLFQSILVMLVMTLIVFVGVNVIGNPIDILVPPDASQAEKLRIVAHLGLDRPLWIQYLLFLKGILQGDLGTSYVYNQPALGVILERLPATLELAISAMLLSVTLGLPLGLYAGLQPDSWLAKTLMAGSILGFSLPTFWIGLILIMVFSVQLGWLPSGGRGATESLLGVQLSFLTVGGLKHLALPAITLALFKIALVMRLTRAGVREAMPQDYVRYARARGLPEGQIVGIHVLKNIMIPIVTVIGLEFGSLIAFSVVTESVFAWPGMGKLIIDSIKVLDRPIVVAYLVLVMLIFVGINLLTDMVYTVLDPRVRLGRKRGA